MPDPDEIDARFADAADDVLRTWTELLRRAVPSHQAAIAIVVEGDWSSVRKYFSLSQKYADWSTYAVPARGSGLHEWIRGQHGVVRLTEAEVEAHPAFRGFSGQAAHPPMRGWLATTVRDRDDVVWGVVQLSDRAGGGDYDAEDETTLGLFTDGLATTLQALWDLRTERKRAAA